MGEATRCAHAVVEALLGAGVREAVLSPGSRSAPLAYALFAADAAGALRLHVRLDERTAGFLALGLAKASGRPVPVLTTSGTATANLHPAVLEAWHSHVPLVAVTASRPRTLTHTGANQTTDSEHLYGRHVVAYAGVSDAVADEPGWRFELTRLLAAAVGTRSRRSGPVQLNVELSEPLAPGPGEPPWAPAPGLAPPTVAAARPADPVELGPGPRTVVVAGDDRPAPGQALADQAAAAGVPLLAEPSSNARRGPAAIGTHRLLLGSPLADEVERVVVVGHPTLSRPVTALLSRAGVELVVVSEYADWVDPGRRAARVVDGVELPEPDDESRAWLQRWQQADRALRPRVDALLDAQPYLSGPVVARTVWRSLGGGDVLVAGSSNPVRDLDLAPVTGDPPTVYANRGLAGIDGTVSTAAGVALAAARPTTALLGDVTFLHDTSGLYLGPDEPRPELRIVVANDDGGSIFAGLEHGGSEHADLFERVFATPHGVSVEALAGAAGWRFRRVTTAAQLATALDRPPRGLEVVEAVVDRSHRRRLTEALAGLGTSSADRG